MIRNNAHKYPVSAMCDVLQIPRSTYYYQKKEQKNNDDELVKSIVQIFKNSRNIYGQRKIKKELEKQGKIASRRKIGQIMIEQGLVSKYTVAQYKPSKASCNESEVGNKLNREFKQTVPLKVIVSDLTYVRVGETWHYICVIVDLFNREIIGYSSGSNKTAALVQCAFASIPYSLNRISLFHTDRGKEFDNSLIDQALKAFGIERSLSEKGSPYDNAVAEATFKTIKTEFIHGVVFPSQRALELELFDYVNWFNNIRIHSSLDYLTPKEYKHKHQMMYSEAK